MCLNMLTYIKEEQSVCERVLKNRKQILKDIVENEYIKNTKKIIVLATGSSLNAFLCSKLYIEKMSSVELSYINPSEFINYTSIWDKDSVFFAISQTGRSASTIEALKKADCFDKSFAITYNENSPLVKAANYFIKIDCGEEKIGFVTKGMMSTALILMLAGLELGLSNGNIDIDTYNSEILKIEDAILNINNTLDISKNWIEKNKDYFLKAKRFIFVSYGSSIGVTFEAQTKFTETIRVPTASFEMEEFLHGPCYELNKDCLIIYMASYNDKLNNRMIDIMNYLDKFAGKSLYIGYMENENYLTIKQVDEYISPILYLIPIQYASHIITEYKNIDINKKMFPDMDNVLERKIFE
ncbi:SIS domain-containing protein [Brachyspira sp.]|uniref:SIS domain-containing protein n=1 Tax=Brachyspira sp. TaxID=1977261 RepID=UPI002630959C|nr:SIS domain-containing protein [Brachyspira sp.]